MQPAKRKESSYPPLRFLPPVALKNVNRLMQQQQLTHISSAAQTFAQSNGAAGLNTRSLSQSPSACLAPKCMLHIIIDGVRQRDEYAVVRT